MQKVNENNPAFLVVYGTLKRGYSNNRLLNNPHSKYIGDVSTKPDYTLFNGGFPIVERGGKTSIKGELFAVDNQAVLERVHMLEGFSGVPNSPENWYDMDTVEVEVEGVKYKAGMYVMNPGRSGRPAASILEDGLWGR